uniref:Uncharacterized protein n=1 Tax=Cacopsylla melanoneura TaxID=428564 RepID=A0A8D9EIQ5_9HEMI
MFMVDRINIWKWKIKNEKVNIIIIIIYLSMIRIHNIYTIHTYTYLHCIHYFEGIDAAPPIFSLTAVYYSVEILKDEFVVRNYNGKTGPSFELLVNPSFDRIDGKINYATI